MPPDFLRDEHSRAPDFAKDSSHAEEVIDARRREPFGSHPPNRKGKRLGSGEKIAVRYSAGTERFGSSAFEKLEMAGMVNDA
jgi:hypothetical protein